MIGYEKLLYFKKYFHICIDVSLKRSSVKIAYSRNKSGFIRLISKRFIFNEFSNANYTIQIFIDRKKLFTNIKNPKIDYN